MKRILAYVFLVLSLLPYSFSSFSQDNSVISPFFTLQYFKNNDGRKYLQSSVKYSKNDIERPLPGMEVLFYTGTDNKQLLSSALTGENGIAKIELLDNMAINTDSEGRMSFSSELKGNDTITASNSELLIKDVRLEMTLSEVDSIKTVTVSAFISDGGVEKPVAAEVVKVYTPTMFVPFPIGEITLDGNGTGSLEFPNDFPGKDGMLTVMARFEENMNFGNVEKTEVIKWGIPKAPPGSVTHRALWTKTAPRWMIYTLSVLLAGVWGHYMFAIFSLIRIRLDAKREAKKDYKE
jgi:hypothetical protein